MTTVDLLTLIARDTPLRRTATHNGGEYSGPCPLCQVGTDRFKVWPQQGRWACLGAKAGRSGCDRGGDAIAYLCQRDGLSYREACDRLAINTKGENLYTKTQRRRGAEENQNCVHPVRPSSFAPLRVGVDSFFDCAEPNPLWQARAAEWAEHCAALLWQAEGARARAYLHSRGLGDDLLRAFNLGYNPHDLYEDRALWGLPRTPDGAKSVWLPRGITIPWRVGGRLWRVNIRRPLSAAQIAGGQAKYIGPAGFGNALYNADALALSPPRPAVLVEGELDALTVAQACGDQVAVVATGSTAGARRARWIAALCQAPIVLLAFDIDQPAADGRPGAGDQAAAWWTDVLPNARRWHPWRHDVNSLPDPDLVRSWVMSGVGERVSM